MKSEFRLALITGATSGIGQAIAEKFATEGLNLIVTGRREERLQALKQELEKKFSVKVKTLAFDVSKHSAVKTHLATLGADLKQIDVLVNNAGLARGTDKAFEASIEDWEEMIDTNIKGLLYLTRALLPNFIANKKGHIINLGSVAGRWLYTGGSVYCATKFAVRAISEGLRMDLLGTPVRVTNIEPGMVESEFSEVRFRDSKKAKAVYQGFEPLIAADIAECAWWSLSRPKHVNIQEMVVFPTAQGAVNLVHRD